MSISGVFPPTAIKSDDIYEVELVQIDPLFKVKFPRFSYRYKYNNNQYSCYAPFSLPAFVPGNFKYQTKDGYNKGMENKIKSLTLKGWNDSIPDLVDEVDVLYKDSSNQNVYVVETLKKN